MIYDLIIIGAGAAGLFAGASLPLPVNGLIMEKKSAPGRKLLMSGAGQCNLTHGGSIKDFILHYGNNGARIRPILYRFNNLSVMKFFEDRGIPLMEREDKKVFPASLKAEDILNKLVEGCNENGLRFLYSSPVDRINYNIEKCREPAEGPSSDFPSYTVHCGEQSYQTKKLIIATGGCSYPATGSDGSFFFILREMGIEVVPPEPALVPIFVDQYPFQDLAGISFPDAKVTINTSCNRDALLLTHTCFSGPAILNLSRHARAGESIVINYYPVKSEAAIIRELSKEMCGNSRQLLTVLNEYFNRDSSQSVSGLQGSASVRNPNGLPKRFLETVCRRAGIDGTEKASRLSPALLKSFIGLLVHDEYRIRKLGGFESAMVTAGGVALSEIETKTMESKKYPGLCFAGEVLDADGDTGGYNLQFAFSSGWAAARN